MATKSPILVNLTEHDIIMVQQGGKEFVLPASKLPPARMDVEYEPYGDVMGQQVFRIRYTDTLDLPPEKPGVIFVVSALVAMFNSHRGDLFAPDSYKYVVRNKETGAIEGSKAFVFF
jgi:hypothetical protein